LNWTKTFPGPEPMRVNKWLAHEGVCSRREAEEAIAAGRVSIDGARVDDPGRKIEADQTLTLEQSNAQAPQTFVLNKPVGYVSAQPEGAQVPAARLLTAANLWPPAQGAAPSSRASLAPLGRLDQDSRGLLLLSEDGVLAKAVIGDTSKLDKEYRVRVEGRVEAAKLAQLRHGLSLDGRTLKPALVEEVGASTLRFTLREGRKRQIRRMCDLVGLRVLDLQRVRIGPLELGALPEGKWRPLGAEERDLMLRGA
jgi:23S rRNA pseudouridine2604 synthase